jgi:hypothetical protein
MSHNASGSKLKGSKHPFIPIGSRGLVITFLERTSLVELVIPHSPVGAQKDTMLTRYYSNCNLVSMTPA